jgi:hypothetical protein
MPFAACLIAQMIQVHQAHGPDALCLMPYALCRMPNRADDSGASSSRATRSSEGGHLWPVASASSPASSPASNAALYDRDALTAVRVCVCVCVCVLCVFVCVCVCERERD